MSDGFSDRFWSTRFWASRYFQGGEQNPGSMRASLSGAGEITAVLHQRTGARRRSGGATSGAKPERRVIIVSIKAKLSGASLVGPEISAAAQLRASVSGEALMSPALTGKKDFSKVDAAFWFMAA